MRQRWNSDNEIQRCMVEDTMTFGVMQVLRLGRGGRISVAEAGLTAHWRIFDWEFWVDLAVCTTI